jgi:hypothetical protein
LPAFGELLGSVELGYDLIARDAGIGANEPHAHQLADAAVPAVTANEVLSAQVAHVRLHDHFRLVLFEALELDTATDLDSEFVDALAQDPFERFLGNRAHVALWIPLLFLIDQEDRREMSARLLHGSRSEARAECGGHRRHAGAVLGCERVAEPPPLQRFCRYGPDGGSLEGLVWLQAPLEHQRLRAGRLQLEREQQPNRPGADDDHVMGHPSEY